MPTSTVLAVHLFTTIRCQFVYQFTIILPQVWNMVRASLHLVDSYRALGVC